MDVRESRDPAPFAGDPQASEAGGLLPIEDALAQLRATTPPPAPQARRRGGH
ncbi:hypothetical protein [Rhodococcus sp. NPDC003348]